MFGLMLAFAISTGPMSVDSFVTDTASVTIAGNPLVGTIEVVHQDGAVFVNGYQVYPSIPRVRRVLTTPTATDLARRELMVALNAIERSNQDAVAFLRTSLLVDSAWVEGSTLYLLWHGQKTKKHVYRGHVEATIGDRSGEYYSLLTTYLRAGMSVYLGERYVIAFPPTQQMLEQRVRQAAVTASSPQEPEQKYQVLINDLRSPRDLNDLKRR